jgi:DNA-binding GntR family transcriptional regulator
VSSGEIDAGEMARMLHRAASGPLHSQVEEGLRQLIRSGKVPAGAELPGELDLAASLHLSRHTVRHALNTLATEGLVRRERGRGTHVIRPVASINQRSFSHFYAFVWEVNARGLEARSRVLNVVTLDATADFEARLDLGSDRKVQRIVRVRMAGDEPLVLETAYFPLDLVEGLTTSILERASIYDEIERWHGVRVTRAHETIRPAVLSRRIAGLLHVRPGSAALDVERTTWAGKRRVEWQDSLVRGDRFLYSVDLKRGDGGFG